MLQLLQKRGLPLGFLTIAAAAAALYVVRPGLIAGGLIGAFLGGAAALAAALAAYLLLFTLVGGVAHYPAPPLTATISYVVAAGVLVGVFTRAEPDPGVDAAVAIAAPTAGVIMFLAALWFHRGQDD